MDNLRLPEKNTATRNSFEVVLKALGGFIIGLIVTVWAVPGVPDAVTKYFSEHWMEILVVSGSSSAIGTGLINLVLDIRKKGMRNY